MSRVPDMKARHRVIVRANGKKGNCMRKRTREEAITYFWAKVDKSNGCWIWRGAPAGGGYGQYMFQKRRSQAHRISWELYHGPIPDGLDVLHTCDVRLCVNPSHLYLGKDAENMRDCIARGRMCNGEKHPNAKLNMTQVAAIRASGKTGAALAVDYGVSTSLIYAIRKNEAWRHVPVSGVVV